MIKIKNHITNVLKSMVLTNISNIHSESGKVMADKLSEKYCEKINVFACFVIIFIKHRLAD